MDSPINSFAELRTLLAELPGPDAGAAEAARQREAVLTKPPGALGRLEEIAAWMAMWQGRHPPSVDRPRICVFAGNHGVAARGVSAFPADVTAQMVQNFQAGGAAVNQLAGIVDAELRVLELALDHPTVDFTTGPALTEQECLNAFAYGMASVEPGLDLVAVGEMGIANTTAAAAICHTLYGGGPADWTGPGTGVTGAALANKAAVVGRAVELHRAVTTDEPLQTLRCLGGHEIAAMAGAIIGARLLRIPVLLDGYVCGAAAAALHAAESASLDHCLVSHRSAEPAHGWLAELLGKEPLFDLGMRLGEASGAALAIGLVRAAVACHTGMASFGEAGVATASPAA